MTTNQVDGVCISPAACGWRVFVLHSDQPFISSTPHIIHSAYAPDGAVVHFAGILGLLLGICRPFNPDNSRICARLYSVPALRILHLKLRADVKGLLEHQRSCVIVANHPSNYDLFVVGSVLINRSDAAHARQAMLTTRRWLLGEKRVTQTVLQRCLVEPSPARSIECTRLGIAKGAANLRQRNLRLAEKLVRSVAPHAVGDLLKAATLLLQTSLQTPYRHR